MPKSEEDWSDWAEHDGSGIPLPIGTLVHRKFDREIDYSDHRLVEKTNEAISRITGQETACWDWSYPRLTPQGKIPRVIRYRFRISKALRDLKRIAANPQNIDIRQTEEA